MESFGEMLRRLRKSRSVTLRGLAGDLGVSVSYLSDVERGRRAPLTNERICKICEILAVEERSRLITAAAVTRGHIEKPVHEMTTTGVHLAASLMHFWEVLSTDDLEMIAGVLRWAIHTHEAANDHA